jgi:dienelactone hydrolase
MFLSTQSGTLQTYAWDLATGDFRQVSDRQAGTIEIDLDPHGRFFYFLNDTHGNEIGHFARFPYTSTLETGPLEDLSPDLPPFAPGGSALSLSGRWFAFTACWADGFHTYLVELFPDGRFSAPREVCHFVPLSFGPVLSYNGDVAVMRTTEKSSRPECNLVAVDTAAGERLNELWDGENTHIDMFAFSPIEGDYRLAATTNRTGFEQVLIWDVKSGARTDLAFPGVEGSLAVMAWSPDGKRLLVRSFHQARQRLFLYDLDSDRCTPLASPEGVFAAPIFRPDGELFVAVEDAAHPTRVLALSSATGEQKRVVLETGSVPPGHQWRSVHYPSTGGYPIQAWLSTPPGSGLHPSVVHMVGGPGGVAADQFHPIGQTWADHGFAFLTLNYRGCGTFGRQHQTSIYGDLGHREVEDAAAAYRYLVDEGIADPDQVLVTGFSYGGYLTLMSLSKYPDLWAGGMAGIAIADWSMLWEDTADTLRNFLESLLGGTPKSNPDQYARSSPLTYAEAVKAPLLIIQGENDTRAPARPVRVYEQKMRDLGKDIEVVWFETGHLGDMADIELSISHMEKMLKFAERVLGL